MRIISLLILLLVYPNFYMLKKMGRKTYYSISNYAFLYFTGIEKRGNIVFRKRES